SVGLASPYDAALAGAGTPCMSRGNHRHVGTVYQRDPDVFIRFRAAGLGRMQWPVAADQSKSGVVLVARHDLRRQWLGQLCVAKPEWPSADSRRFRLCTGPVRWQPDASVVPGPASAAQPSDESQLDSGNAVRPDRG